jgi:hypothetical protein
MPATQLISVVGRSSDPTANTLNPGFLFNNTNGSWGATVGTYPFTDNGQTNYVVTSNLGLCNNISVNLWFYPRALNRILMTEQDSLDENTGYHYTMLEIDGAGYIRGRVWDGIGATFATTGNAVTLNKWNHIYLTYSTGSGVIISLNGANGVQEASIVRLSPGVNEYIGVGTYSVTRIAADNRFRGKFSDLRVSNTGETSTFFSTYTNYDMGNIGP